MKINPELAPKLMKMITAFEGGGLAGNFDGQILSWGALQWNLGQNTLGAVLRRIHALEPKLVEMEMGARFCAAISSDASLVEFARREILGGLQTPSRLWRERFSRLAALKVTPRVWGEFAQSYLDNAVKLALACDFQTERGLALCFDISVQNGAPRADHIQKYKWSKKIFEVLEWQRLKVMANAVADCANPQWHDDVLSRKLTLALGQGEVHKKNYNLERDFGISYSRKWGVK